MNDSGKFLVQKSVTCSKTQALNKVVSEPTFHNSQLQVMDDQSLVRMESEMGSMKELLHGLSAQMASLVEKKKKKNEEEASSSKSSKNKGAMG